MRKLIIILFCLTLVLCACSHEENNSGQSEQIEQIEAIAPSKNQNTPKAPVQAAQPASESTPAPGEPEVSPSPEPVIPEEPKDEVYCLSFVGDCTLGTDYDTYGTPGSFVALTGDDYDYPFTFVREYFEDDDFTMVNLECALTNYNVPNEKQYRFRGPPEYAKILSGSSVECAILANNHSGDYGAQGLEDTKAALDAENVGYVPDSGTFIYQTSRGLKIGVCAFFGSGWDPAAQIRSLRERGAQLIIASYHFGEEGSYTVTDSQIYRAHMAVDAGADIVVGTHPHVLQRTESYHGGLIYYSLGNFSFGGNRNPRDKDTVIMRQYVTLSPEGKLTLGETVPVPCRLSSEAAYNDYRPQPYEEGSAEYERVLSKLSGTLVPAPLITPKTEENKTEPEPEQENGNADSETETVPDASHTENAQDTSLPEAAEGISEQMQDISQQIPDEASGESSDPQESLQEPVTETIAEAPQQTQ